jgi:hypothetical protein
LSIGDDDFVLTWENTSLNTFFVGYGEYDHITHQLPDGRYVALPLSYLGMAEVKDALIDMEFQHTKSPTLDEATIEWFVSIGRDEIDQFELPPL